MSAIADTIVTTAASDGANVVTKNCSVSECTKPIRTRGLCVMHYRRLVRHGDITTVHATGKKPVDKIASIAANVFTEWSSRKRERYSRAWRLSIFAGVEFTELIATWSRPNGSINVNAMLEHAEGIAAMKLAAMDGGAD